MNDRRPIYAYPVEGIRPGEIFDCRPAAVYGDMQCESQMTQSWMKADYASSESGRDSSELLRLIEEILEQNLPKFDTDIYRREFVDFGSAPRRKGREPKRPEELKTGDTSSLDAFMGEFRVLKGVENV